MTSEMRLQLFGTPAVEHGDASHALAFERRTQLLVLLALRRGWVQRAEVAAMLWPEHEARLAFGNLRKTLFRLQLLPWAASVEMQGNALRWQVATDVGAFEAALAAGRAGDALAAYGGELLAGFDDGSSEPWTTWLAFEREQLRTRWRGAALALLESQPPAAQAISLSARLLEADPLDETALREHMAALARDGQAAAARQAYRQFVERVASELGIEPGAELRALHDTLGQAPAPSPRPAPAAAAPDDGFIGRAGELRRIAALLGTPECRLLCISGPGGIGKTRLARRAMVELTTTFADGHVFVDLEDAATPARLGSLLAQATRTDRVRGGRDPLALATAAIGERELLLVLDNFEGLVAHASLLERLLAACPRLKLLVTSRVRLNIDSEWTLPLEGLPVPDPEDDDRAESFDAVRLFVKAARRIEPALDVDGERAAIVDICRRVEGQPLALELAAAWVRLLSCTTIAAELQRGTELLAAYDPTQPARHASIEMVFEQTWRHLSEAEREALARLAVFRGGFPPDAVRTVAGASLPVLAVLSDKSLLRKGDGRLHLHPLVQQLARARLGDGDTLAATEAAHATHFLRWMARLHKPLEHGERDALLAMDAEFENCGEAWLCAARLARSDELAGALRPLLNYCDHRGRFDEGLALLRQAADSPASRADERLLARLLACLSHLKYRLGRYTEAGEAATRALAAARTTRDNDARLQALGVLAACALYTGRLAEARRLYQRSLGLAAPETRSHNMAATLDNLALVEKRLGRYDEALRLQFESLAMHRRIGDSAGVALCLNNLAATHMVLHNWQAAQVHLREALTICDRDGLGGTRGLVLANLAESSMALGDLDASERYGRRGIEAAQAGGHRALAAWLQIQRARLQVRRADLGEARTSLVEGLGMAQPLGAASLKIGALLAFAELLEAQQQPDAARRVVEFAATHPGTSAVDRDELRTAWSSRKPPDRPDPPWPEITLEDLLRRIVEERGVAHAPLLAALGS